MMNPFSTETLDKIYLEWSQFTTARTEREIELARQLEVLQTTIEDYILDFNNGLGPSIDRLGIVFAA